MARHYRIAIIANLQYMKAQEFNPTMRDNLDFLFVFSQSNHDTKLEVVKQWLGVGDKRDGLEVLEQTAQQYRTLVIDRPSSARIGRRRQGNQIQGSVETGVNSTHG